ncbi:uncharacterized protein [Nicotiana sylvestris]|uniref:Uncharacterized protein LOC104221408 n=1 Tax=Nicotiana sylvestris TaxID=4096 RepID=A0A1U7W7Y8_NICSY|nr:PREDICTED: uncharacterized protein LOC104221408 [Nicotiana sylvestris]XP_009770775.1 PREDICTED: uncharacterized protein LOC104221408 [Nicotiana sylvestris]
MEAFKTDKWEAKGTSTPSAQTPFGQRVTVQRPEIFDKDLLSRCLVGSFSDAKKLPTLSDIRRWATNKWSNIPSIQMYEMHGSKFLFEFPSRKMADHIKMREWRWRNKLLMLEWWSPTVGCYPADAKLDWVWVRLLGIPLHLWSQKIFKLIGDRCGGWIETEEETSIRNHLKWARIKVKGPFDRIPRVIEMEKNGIIFSVPTWCESQATWCSVDSTSEKFEISRGPNPRNTTMGLESKIHVAQESCDIEVGPSFKKGSHAIAESSNGPSKIQSPPISFTKPIPTFTKSPNLGIKNRFSVLYPWDRPDPMLEELYAIHNSMDIVVLEDLSETEDPPRLLDAIENLALHGGFEEEGQALGGGEIIPFSSLPKNSVQLSEYEDKDAWFVDEAKPLDSQFLEAEMEASLWVHKNVLKMSKAYGVNF